MSADVVQAVPAESPSVVRGVTASGPHSTIRGWLGCRTGPWGAGATTTAWVDSRAAAAITMGKHTHTQTYDEAGLCM